MWEASFVNIFQNKDNLLIYTKKICKSSYKMQRNVIAFFCTFIFLSNSQQRSFFLDSGYLHDGRADKNPYPHNSNNQCIIQRLQLFYVMINVQLMLV